LADVRLRRGGRHSQRARLHGQLHQRIEKLQGVVDRDGRLQAVRRDQFESQVGRAHTVIPSLAGPSPVMVLIGATVMVTPGGEDARVYVMLAVSAVSPSLNITR